ncbi:MAG: hypothetical protein ACR2HR_12495 [Euzebya sp.]
MKQATGFPPYRRTLVTQTADQVRSWVTSLDLTDHVAVTSLLGGDGKLDATWRLDPTADTILADLR